MQAPRLNQPFAGPAADAFIMLSCELAPSQSIAAHIRVRSVAQEQHADLLGEHL